MKTAIDFSRLIGVGLGGAIALQSFSTLPAHAFNDTSTYWGRNCIAQLRRQNLVRGYPDGSFRPNATVTRTEFAIFMLNAFPDAPKVSGAKRFGDVPASFWGAEAIARATERGFFAGYPDGSFRPQQQIPRVQGLVVLANAGYLQPYTQPEPLLDRYFTDAGQIPNYAKSAIASLTDRASIINYPNVRQLRPNRAMTRGEVAAQICYENGLRNYVSPQYVSNEVNLYRDRFIFGSEIRAFGTSSQNLLMARSNANKIGYISHSGLIVIPLRYDTALPFSDDRAAVGILREGIVRWGYIDLSGDWIVEPQYAIAKSFSEGLAAVNVDGLKFGFIDRDGKTIVPAEYDRVLPFSEGLAAVSKDGKWGFIDKTGAIVIPLKYSSVGSFSDGLARFFLGENTGFVDKTGQEIASFDSDAVQLENFSEGLAAAFNRAQQSWGYLDKSGNWAISPQFQRVQPFSEGLAAVAIDGKWGYIDKSGKIVIPAQFYGPTVNGRVASLLSGIIASSFKDGLAAVRQGDKVGFIDRQGNWKIEPTLFTDAKPPSEGIARVRVGGRWKPLYVYTDSTPDEQREYELEGGGWGYIRLPKP